MGSRLGLLIVSVVVLAIGLMIGAIGYSLNHESVKTYHDMNCGNSLFRGAGCDDRIAMMGAGIAIVVVGGIFIIVGFIASIIFGVKLILRKIIGSSNKMSLYYDFEKWTMIPSFLTGAVIMQDYVSIAYSLISNRRISKSHILD